MVGALDHLVDELRVDIEESEIRDLIDRIRREMEFGVEKMAQPRLTENLREALEMLGARGCISKTDTRMYIEQFIIRWMTELVKDYTRRRLYDGAGPAWHRQAPSAIIASLYNPEALYTGPIRSLMHALDRLVDQLGADPDDITTGRILNLIRSELERGLAQLNQAMVPINLRTALQRLGERGNTIDPDPEAYIGEFISTWMDHLARELMRPGRLAVENGAGAGA